MSISFIVAKSIIVPVELENILIAPGVSFAIKNKLPIFVIINGLGLDPIESTVSFALKPVTAKPATPLP